MGDVDLKIKLNNLSKNFKKFIGDNGGWLNSKNLLNTTLKTTTINGVTCTNNGDGTYTLNGTATNNTEFVVSQNINLISGTNYLGFLSKKLYNGLDSFFQLQKSPWTIYFNINSGTIVHYEAQENLSDIRFVVRISPNTTLDNVVITPMLTTDETVTYDDFKPYNKSNVELTNELATLIETLKSKGVID